MVLEAALRINSMQGVIHDIQRILLSSMKNLLYLDHKSHQLRA